jgi:hypothetical protein
LTRCWRGTASTLIGAAALLWVVSGAAADALSEGQCREDKVATKSLGQAIDCRLTGWDDYVSCADPEAAPDRCDHDDQISRDLRRAFGNPFFRTRAAARAWCVAKSAELGLYNITEADLQSFGHGFGTPTVYQCTDGKPHATVAVGYPGVFFCHLCGFWMRLPQHSFFHITVWGASDVSRDEALR